MTVPIESTRFRQEAKSTRIALVSSDRETRHQLRRKLGENGFLVDSYREGSETRRAFGRLPPDAVVVDLSLCHTTGGQLVKELRAGWNFPILALAHRNDETEEVEAISVGADDYLHTPVSVSALAMRIRAVLRYRARVQAELAGHEDVAEVIVAGHLEMNATRRSVAWVGVPLNVSETEFVLLWSLAKRPGIVKSRAQLMNAAYEDQVEVTDRTIDSHVKRLRKKLRAVDPNFAAIETLYGVGYRFVEPRVAAE